MTDYDQKTIMRALDIVRDERDKKIKPDRKNQIINSWYDYAYSFADASIELLDIVIKDDRVNKRVLNIPIMFNMRHTIELTLKYFSRITKNNVDIEKNHNIMKQFDDVQKSLKNNKGEIDSLTKRYASKGLTEKQIQDYQIKFSDKLEVIVNRYYFHSPFLEGMSSKDFFIEDTNNELFKYPEAKNIIFFPSTDYSLNLNLQTLKNMKDDMVYLRRILRFFDILFRNPR